MANIMKRVQAVPHPALSHPIGRRNHSQLSWSQNSDGDVVAHIQLNREQTGGARAARMGADQIEELIRFHGSNLIEGTRNIELPIFTDEKSATLNFKILSESPDQNAVLLLPSAKHLTMQQPL